MDDSCINNLSTVFVERSLTSVPSKGRWHTIRQLNKEVAKIVKREKTLFGEEKDDPD